MQSYPLTALFHMNSGCLTMVMARYLSGLGSFHENTVIGKEGKDMESFLEEWHPAVTRKKSKNHLGAEWT